MSARGTVRIFETREAASRAVAHAFAAAARRAVGERGRFAVALAGGTTPRPVYEALAADHREDVPWSSTHFFWSDERFVPPEDPESNYRMAKETLFSSLELSADNLHVPWTALDDPEDVANRYEEAIRAFFHPEAPRLDWTFLGLGEDGHVASLFPGAPALLSPGDRLVLPVTESPKPPTVRITMTLPLINLSREIHFLVFGGAKREVLVRTLEAGETLPAQRVGPAVFWIDRDAAGSNAGAR